jgi:PAS domain S-box-containing protein
MWGSLRRWLNLLHRSESTSQRALIAALAREQELAEVYASLGKTVVDLAQANDELEREISVRCRAEIALRDREATLESIFAASPDIITIVEADGRIRMINPAIREILGHAPEAWIGRNALDLVHPEAHEQLSYVLRGLVAGRRHEARYRRIRCRHAEGFWKVLETNGRIIAGTEMTPTAVVVVARDVTAQVRLEESLRESEERYRDAARIAEAASQAKSEFLSRMSHNLRTPLNSVLGFAQLLQMGSLSDQQRESVEYILLAGRHLLDMINEALDLSRIEAGGLMLGIEPFPLADLLSESLDLIRPALLERRIALHFDADAAGDLSVLADRQRLKQVILNLLSNAIKYNRASGMVKIECAATRHDRIRVRISDNGPGIAPEHMARLFTPFDRLGAEASGVEGTGLGLVLSRQLVEAMGGTIGAESRAGEGSTFWFEIALVEHSAGAPQVQEPFDLIECECEQMA